MDNWRTMESAPKDGSTIIVWRRNQIMIATWDIDRHARNPRPFWNGHSVWGRSDDRATPPVRWMPAPGAPIDLDNPAKVE